MNYKNFINNEWFDSDSGNTFEVVNPFTEKVIANVPASGKSDIDKAVRAAQVAFKGWSTMTAGGRRDYLQALAQKSMDHADSLAKIISIEMGKPLKDAMTEIEDLSEYLQYLVDRCHPYLLKFSPDQCASFQNFPLPRSQKIYFVFDHNLLNKEM